MRPIISAVMLLLACLCAAGTANAQSVVDLRTRNGVTQRMLVIAPPEPKAAVILFAGGNGGLQIAPNGTLKALGGNFLTRTRQAFAEQGFYVVIVDAPSDRQKEPFLSGFRQTPQHLEDIKATIAWVRAQVKVPIWLIGTSRGTQTVAYVATQLTGVEGPDGLVLTSTILKDKASRAVPQMELDKIKVPILVVHHQQDGCKLCPFSDIPSLMGGLSNAPKKDLMAVTGGQSHGDPCEAQAYHGYNGIEAQVVADISRWILAN